MKRNMRYILPVTVMILLAGASVFAQDKTTPDRSEKKKIGKLRDYDEIVIKRKSDDDKNARVVIEIRDDQVFVDGKPINDFSNNDISVRIQRPRTFSLNGASSPFRGQDNWSFTSGDKPFLGVATEGSTGGAQITEVSENSAAAKAGLKKGDVITRINDKEVFDHEQLSEAIGKFEPGDEVTITYKRNGKESKATAKLGSKPGFNLQGGPRVMTVPPVRPNAPMPPAITMPFDGNNWREYFKDFYRSGAKPRIGMKVQDTEDNKGVKVMEVDEGSAAEKSGIKEDDIITSFDGKAVNSAKELSDAAREARDKSTVKVQLKRNGKAQTLDLKIPKELKTAEL